MHKDVLSAVHANKPKPLTIIKPLDSAFALHTALLSSHQPHGPQTHRARPHNLRKHPKNQPDNCGCASITAPQECQVGQHRNLLCPEPSSITVAGSPVFACRRSTGISCKNSACRLLRASAP